jgi:hypothetical protein
MPTNAPAATARGERWPGLLRSWRREIRGQTGGHQAPFHPRRDAWGMQLSAKQCGEARRAEWTRVGNGIAVLLQEVVGQREEVVATAAVRRDDLLRR